MHLIIGIEFCLWSCSPGIQSERLARSMELYSTDSTLQPLEISPPRNVQLPRRDETHPRNSSISINTQGHKELARWVYGWCLLSWRDSTLSGSFSCAHLHNARLRLTTGSCMRNQLQSKSLNSRVMVPSGMLYVAQLIAVMPRHQSNSKFCMDLILSRKGIGHFDLNISGQ
jgi:hypothetical protein